MNSLDELAFAKDARSEQKQLNIRNTCRDILKYSVPGSRSPEQVDRMIEYFLMVKVLPADMTQKSILSKFCQWMNFLTLEQHTILFIQGQPGTSYFIIFSGAVDIRKINDPQVATSVLHSYGDAVLANMGPDFCKATFGSHLARVTANKGFGEEALLKVGATRAASALTLWKSEIIEIGSDLYGDTLKPFHAAQSRVTEIFEILRNHILSEGLPDRILTEIAYETQPVFYFPQTKILSKKDKIENVIAIKTGEIRELKVKRGAKTEVGRKGSGTLLGASLIIKGETTYHLSYMSVTPVEAFLIPLNAFEVLRRNTVAANRFLELEKARANMNTSTKSTSAKDLFTEVAMAADDLNSSSKSKVKRHSLLHFILPTSREKPQETKYAIKGQFTSTKVPSESSHSIEEELGIKPPPSLQVQTTTRFPLAGLATEHFSGNTSSQNYLVKQNQPQNFGQLQDVLNQQKQMVSNKFTSHPADNECTIPNIEYSIKVVASLERQQRERSISQPPARSHLPHPNSTEHLLFKAKSTDQLLTYKRAGSPQTKKIAALNSNLHDDISSANSQSLTQQCENIAFSRNLKVQPMANHFVQKLSPRKMPEAGEVYKLTARGEEIESERVVDELYKSLVPLTARASTEPLRTCERSNMFTLGSSGRVNLKQLSNESLPMLMTKKQINSNKHVPLSSRTEQLQDQQRLFVNFVQPAILNL